MPNTIIVNSTPIIALSAIDKITLLKELYGTIVIPSAVSNEINVKSNSKAKNQLDMHSDWIHIKMIKNVEQKITFKTQLHEGEVEVIILGQELNAKTLIIDDYLAREYAKYLGFNVVGTVGVLLSSKAKGLIDTVKPFVDKMIKNGFYLNKRLYDEILMIANE